MNNLHDRATNHVPCNIAPFMIPVMYNKKLFQACSTLGVHWSPMAGLMACINWGDNNYKENNKKVQILMKSLFPEYFLNKLNDYLV